MTKAERQQQNSLFLAKGVEQAEKKVAEYLHELDTFMECVQHRQQASHLLALRTDEKKEGPQHQIVDFFGQLEQKVNPILASHASWTEKYEEQNKQSTDRKSKPDETVEDFISKIKKIEESEKIMVREEFKKEYENMKGSKAGRAQGNKLTSILKH